MMNPALVTIALIYAIASETPPDTLGERIEAGNLIPSYARGVLVPDQAVLQLGERSRARFIAEEELVSLEEGRLRLIAENRVVLKMGAISAVLQPGAVAYITRSSEQLTVCTETGTVHLTGLPTHRTTARDGEGVDGSAESEAGSETEAGSENEADPVTNLVNGQVREGQCWSSRSTNITALDPLAPLALRRAAESRAPRPVELPDLVGDPTEHFAEVEQQLGDQLDSGPQREAASCGCSETSGSGGSLDPTGGGGTGPRPEPPEPGRLLIRIRIPSR